MSWRMTKATTSKTGRAGERLAVAHLKKNGYKIIETNYRCRGGEIDIIARHRSTLVFIEVKARSSDLFGSPFEAVNAAKQVRIINAAKAYLAERNAGGVAVRFDVVGVFLDREPPLVEIIADAFQSNP